MRVVMRFSAFLSIVLRILVEAQNSGKNRGALFFSKRDTTIRYASRKEMLSHFEFQRIPSPCNFNFHSPSALWC
jgi:hypothetical protein